MLSPRLLSSTLAVAAIALPVAGILSIPHIRQLGIDRSAKRIYLPIDDKEDDEDITLSNPPKAIWQRITLVVAGAIGAVAGFPFPLMGDNIAVISSPDANTLRFVAWALLFLQELILATCRKSEDRYRLGCYSGVAALIMGVAMALTLAIRLQERLDALKFTTGDALLIVQLVASLVLFFVNLSIPRGPTMCRNGHKVDEQSSVSFLNKYTFSWARGTLALAVKNGHLDADDLPLVAEEVRARSLVERFASAKSASTIWGKWFRIYGWVVIAQVFVQIVANIVHFLPNLLLLVILRLFEERDTGSSNQLQLWLAGLGLGMSLILVSWGISLRDFLADLMLSLPIHEQLFAVITNKAMRLNDIVMPANGGEDDEEEEEEEGDSDSEDAPRRTKHSILNLLGVDVDAISDFMAYSHLLLDCVLEFIATMIFLLYLIGWKPTVVGCAVPVLMTPVYYYLTKRYSDSNHALMECRDEKSGVLTEMVRGMRQIKFSALETEWYKKINKLRAKELQKQRTLIHINVGIVAVWSLGPFCMSVLSLVAYIYVNGAITPSVAFTALSIFEGLQNILGIVPEILTDLLETFVSVKRIQRFLALPEHQDSRVPSAVISFRDATIGWPSSESASEDAPAQFRLRDLNLDFPSRQLSVISGRSGAGKSLLLHALIGEAATTTGSVFVPHTECPSGPCDEEDWIVDGHIAYVSQDPWIENATVRDSILFGLPLHQPRYNDVLEACALTRDLQMFADGDLTDIGSNGINLSGGQKWRLAFARALYSRAGILVLDDIFSAVDSHVGNHLYERALTGKLSQGRTRILATHHVRLCVKDAAYWVTLENGRVLHAGPPDSDLEDESPETIVPEEVSQSLANGTSKQPNESRRGSKVGNISRRGSKVANGHTPEQESANGVAVPKKYYEEEKRERGKVKLGVYKTYMQACGGYIHWILIIILFVVFFVLNLAAPYWVSLWTRAYDDDSAPPKPGVSPATHNLVYYGGIYLALSAAQWLLGIIRYYLVMRGSLKASKATFEQFANAILRAPLRFLDTTPAGQILNRFTSDFGTLDSDLAENLAYMLQSIVLIVGIMASALVTSPLILGLGLLAFLGAWGVAYFYITGAREAKRLESTARSPIFELVGSLLTGLPTIRAFGREQDYLARMYDLIDAHCTTLYHRRLFNCWMAFWLSIVGACFVAAVTIMFVNIRSLDAPLAGFALSFALQLSDNISWLLSEYSQLELDFNATERIVEYVHLEQEPQSGIDVPAAWPTRGELEVRDLHVGYAPDQPAILKGLNFSIRQGERVGIVGRTGAGKSSLAMTLLRCLEARSGSIHVDGVDIATVRLHDLRSRLGIISQDPIVFAGTVRQVLDPFDQHDEGELRGALEKVSLIPVQDGDQDGEGSESSNSSDEGTNVFSLSFAIAEEGKNLSQGQRQLLCLARALVSRPKILIMDEATASIDMESDIRIQRTLREEIRGCTLLVIAHRLSTIADFDRVIVLDEGRVVEMDTPAGLMGVEGGIFRGLVEGSGERRAIERMIHGLG